MSKNITYKDAGVDISGGEDWSRSLESKARQTYGPRVYSGLGGFAGLYRLDYNEQLFRKNYREPLLVSCTDGVGTKLLVAQHLGKYDTVGIDLVAMNVNDLVVTGAEPLFFLDYMAVGKLDKKAQASLMTGITEGCKQARCALLGGETAEMPDMYDNGEFDLAGFSVGVVELKKLIDGSKVEPGDIILGLASNGIHSNGYSLARKIVFDKLKLKPDDEIPGCQDTTANVMLAPTRIYVKPILSVLQQYKRKMVIHGMAHITGGGLEGNVIRVLPENCRAVIRKSSWQVPKIFEFLARKGPVDEKEMFHVFNMGIGMVLIVSQTFAGSITKQLTKAGERVFEIGRIKSGKTGVEVR